MAETIQYKYITVNSGSSQDPENPSTEADNNTLSKISSIEGIDVNVLLALNPVITNKLAILSPGDRVLAAVGNITSTYKEFSTATLMVYPSKTSDGNYQMNIVRSDGTTVSKFTIPPNSTNTSQPDISLETIAKNGAEWFNSKIEIEALLNLNGYLIDEYLYPEGQSHLLPFTKKVLVEVCSPGSGLTAKIKESDIIAGTKNCYIRWEWDHKANSTSGMEVWWEYQTTDGRWLTGQKSVESDLEVDYSIHTPNDNAVKVRVAIRPKEKSISSTSYSVSTKFKWSAYKEYDWNYNWSAVTPSAPSVEVNKENNTLTVSYENIKQYAAYGDKIVTNVEFQILRSTENSSYSESPVGLPVNKNIEYGHVKYVYKMESGYEYRVRARFCHTTSTGMEYKTAWSDTAGPYKSIPIAPKFIDYSKSAIDNITIFNWYGVYSVEGYKLQLLRIDNNLEVRKAYESITDKSLLNDFFDTIVNTYKSEVTDVDVDINSLTPSKVLGATSYKYFNATNGHYLVRVRAVNETGESKWSNIIEMVNAEPPQPPTTWSSVTVASLDDPIVFYWIHNSKDQSMEAYYEIDLLIDDRFTSGWEGISKIDYDDYEPGKPNSEIWIPSESDMEFTKGFKLEWRVRTASYLDSYPNGQPVWGEWSMKRRIDVYSKPSLFIDLVDNEGETIDGVLRNLPLCIYLGALDLGSNQTPVGYHISVIAQRDHTITDNVGNEKIVTKGNSVFSRYYNSKSTDFQINLTPKELSLTQNETYRIEATVSLSSGLTAVCNSEDFIVNWDSQGYGDIQAEVGINDSLTARIRPYIKDNPNANVSFFVYRREFDGTFTELITDSSNPESGIVNDGGATWITDPHPSLDYARYRVVARDNSSGVIKYEDIPSIPIQEKSVVIQWNEKWESIDIKDGEIVMENADLTYKGSILKLPYNIDVSNAHSPDVSLVRYIGRNRPVSYYGTQRGETATWNVEIPKSDTETLYALRQLAIYMGDIYVREPSGSGYWASINISFSQAHKNLTIPVTINITPVEGGI